jgi:hypothetical protein
MGRAVLAPDAIRQGFEREPQQVAGSIASGPYCASVVSSKTMLAVNSSCSSLGFIGRVRGRDQ